MRADEITVPGVVGHAGGGAVDGYDAAAGVDEGLQRGELGGREDVADALEEDDDGVGGELGGTEEGGVFGCGNCEGICFGCEGGNGADAGGDGGVPVAGGFTEDEDVEGGGVGHVGGWRWMGELRSIRCSLVSAVFCAYTLPLHILHLG